MSHSMTVHICKEGNVQAREQLPFHLEDKTSKIRTKALVFRLTLKYLRRTIKFENSLRGMCIVHWVMQCYGGMNRVPSYSAFSKRTQWMIPMDYPHQ